MNFFVVYLALPALFFRLLSETPFEQLANVSFVAATTFTTYIVFAISFCIGVVATRGSIGESTILGIAGAYSNVGYMGPGLTLAVLGEQATVPTALILAFDNALMFILAPLLMALAGSDNDSFLGTLRKIGLSVADLHPSVHPCDDCRRAGRSDLSSSRPRRSTRCCSI